MAAPKGRRPPNAGKGRPKGSANRSSVKAKEAIALFIDANTHRLQAWLDEIAKSEGAKAAFVCFTDLLEFHVPKLARTEVTGKDGAELVITIHAEPLDVAL